MPRVVIALTTGTVFTIPGDFPLTGGTLKVECIGAGAAGGGAYAVNNLSGSAFEPLKKLFFQIGFNGTDTWLNTTNTAPLGSTSTTGCRAAGSSGFTGGAASNCTPTSGAYSGGDLGSIASGGPGYGGAAGPNGAGGNGGNAGTVGAGGGGGANGGSAGSAGGVVNGGAGGNNRLGTGGGAGAISSTTNSVAGVNGGGGGGGNATFGGANASQDPVWTDYKGTVYGPGSGAGNGTGGTGLPAGYGGGIDTDANSSNGLIVVSYDTGGISATTYTEIITATNNLDNTWRVPYGVTSVSVQAIGAGGTPSSTVSQYAGGGGGYSQNTSITVTPNNRTFIQIGAANSTGALTGDTWLNVNTGAPTSATNALLAKGSGANTSSTNGGGVGTTQYGTTTRVGGNGGQNSISQLRGGGGGGAAGPTAAGGNGGAAENSGTSGGGAGGGGANGKGNGSNGAEPNGGNGGGSSGSDGLGATTAALATAGVSGGGGGGGANTTTLAARRNAAAGSQETITAWNFQGNTFGPGGGGGGGGRNSAANTGTGGDAGGYGGGGGSFSGSGGGGGGTGGLLVITYTVEIHESTGALTGPGSTIAGTAVHTARSGPVTHPTSGALTGAGSTVVGASTRFRTFTTTGALTGAGSAIAGAALRFRTFATSGSLVGAGAAIVGVAAKLASHATSGILTAAGAVIAGAAEKILAPVTHTTSGDLVAGVASIFGVAKLNDGLGGLMAVTAGDQINRALRLLGVLAEGETTSASVSQDSLAALDQMIDSWNTERLSVFSTQDQVFTWPADQITRTLGPTGNFEGNRPIQVDDATYFRDPGTNVSYGIKLINQAQYDGIAVKTVTSTYPQVMFVNNEYPNISMTIYPKPTRDLEWHFISVSTLSQPATLNTVLAFPPGYLRAFVYNLAMEIAPEFGVEPSEQVKRIAMTSKRNLKRINSPDDIMSMPYALVSGRQRFNIYSGNY